VNALLKVTVIVFPALRAPALLVVKPTAHEAVAAAVGGVPAKVTAVTAVPPVWPMTNSPRAAEDMPVTVVVHVVVPAVLDVAAFHPAE
jgi:hypothetical protein